MEILFKRIAWNEHETALLVEVYEKMQNVYVFSFDDVTKLSKRLRGPMLKDGVAISEKYRNVADMDLQLNVIERYMSGGNDGFGSGSIPRTFEKIISLKRESPTSFNNLLDEANLLYPAIQEVRYDVAKLDEDTGMVSEPEVKITPTMTSLFDWNKYEATLIVNLYNQILNGSLIETEACDLVMKKFLNCSPVIDCDVLPCQDDLSSVLSDVRSYEKGILKGINYELERSLELSKSNFIAFRELLNSAMKLYPLNSIVSFFDRNSKKKESDNKVDSEPTISVEIAGNDLVDSDFPEHNNDFSTNTITEEEQKAYIPVNVVETKDIKEIKQEYKPRRKSIIDIVNESQLINSIASLKKDGRYTIDDFYTIKNRIYHMNPLRKVYSPQIIPPLPPFHRYLYNVNYSQFRLFGVNSPIIFFVGIDGKACHAIPLEAFIPSPKDGDYIIKQNPYGVYFAIWYVDAAKCLSNDDVFELAKESICFNTLKPDSYIEPEQDNKATIVTQNVVTKTVVAKKENRIRLQPNMKIKNVLVDYYKNGYRLRSNMDRKRLADFYEQKYAEALTLDGESLDKEVSKCGIVCAGNKLYVPEEMLDATIKDDLFDYINKQFDNNLQCIYYNVLFKEFSDRFLGQKILDDSMLHSYLEFCDIDEVYTFEVQYFSKDSDFSLDVNSEVIEFVKEQGCCIYETELVSALSFIPEIKVREAFNGNKNTLLTAGRGKRFHISNFQLEIEDKQVVIDYLSKEIKDVKFVSFLEVLDKLKIIAPRVVDNNVQFSDTGIRSALSVVLNDLFYIRGGIISDIKSPISLQDAFVDFARGRSSFTVEEAQFMADDFATLINFEALAIHNIRVSDELYISKDSIDFPTEDIDNAIEMFCKGDFISISDVSTFAAFPEYGYNWNKFLLESYVYDSSKKFCLYHNRFNKTSVSGAIVRKSAKYNNYNEVLANALSDTNISLDKKMPVLEYLAETGFIARRQLDGIDQVVYRAKQLKN